MESNQKSGWRILPVNGDTGMAYMGVNNDKRLFLKRNTSPFLAALSIEEISVDKTNDVRGYLDCSGMVKWTEPQTRRNAGKARF